MKSHSSRKSEKTRTLEFRPLSSRIVARARPLVSYARTPVPTLPKSPPSPSSAHRFFAGFKPEGDSGGDLFLGTTTAPARCTGVEGPSVFVRRYRVPQALQSIGLDAGPRRHCGESAFGGFRGEGGRRRGYRQRTSRSRTTNASMRGSAGSRGRAGHRVRPLARLPGASLSTKRDRRCRTKKAKGKRRGTYRQRRSGRTVPPA
jgi:hypothetical protein